MPRRPQPAARRGTRFHAWVEARFEPLMLPLLEPEELPGSDAEIADDEQVGAGVARTTPLTRAGATEALKSEKIWLASIDITPKSLRWVVVNCACWPSLVSATVP